jgi:hypothetical protein
MRSNIMRKMLEKTVLSLAASFLMLAAPLRNSLLPGCFRFHSKGGR